MIQNAFKSRRGMFAQVDPSNKDSDVSPQDLKLEIPEPTEDERDLVALVKRRFDAASSVKEIHVREWLICCCGSLVFVGRLRVVGRGGGGLGPRMALIVLC